MASVLNAAALTYVAGAVAAVAQLVYFLLLSGLLGGDEWPARTRRSRCGGGVGSVHPGAGVQGLQTPASSAAWSRPPPVIDA